MSLLKVFPHILPEESKQLGNERSRKELKLYIKCALGELFISVFKFVVIF